ncbi:MAG: NTP transferase domain-containing protein [Candidatus Verstraetearchaeota archaeon]|nr:NTP transferase domain-containing protein [Candidatus Verstraetearchaeota archaeon]
MGFAGLVMAGGRGSRLRVGVEKPLLPICGETMLKRVVKALKSSKFVEAVFIAVSEWTPNTKREAERLGIVIETGGLGYVDDLREALRVVWAGYGFKDVVVASSDLPLLDGELIDDVVKRYAESGKEALTVVVDREAYEGLGFDAEYLIEYGGKLAVPVGLNVLRADLVDRKNLLEEEVYLHPRVERLVNVNTIEEAKRAEEILRRLSLCEERLVR